jgi:hypothetical protein
MISRPDYAACNSQRCCGLAVSQLNSVHAGVTLITMTHVVLMRLHGVSSCKQGTAPFECADVLYLQGVCHCSCLFKASSVTCLLKVLAVSTLLSG